jgi:opacity protein-like surface antigen
MKNFRRISSLIVFLVILAISMKTSAQLKMQLGYQVSKPTGAFKDAIENTSFRGFAGEINYSITPQIGVGLGVSYNDFYQKYPRQTYQTGEGHISAVVTNSIQVMPVLVKGNYNFLKEGPVIPYAGLGAGINLVNYDQYLGEFPASNATLKAAFSGEAGIKIPVGYSKEGGINIGAHYNYLPYNYSGIKNLNNWGAHVGFYFPLRR